MICENCDYTGEEPHALTEGVCVCGDGAGDPVKKEDFTIRHTLDLASDISVNYAVPVSQLEGFDLSTVTMECRIQGPEGERAYVLEPELRGQYYYFTLGDLTAVHMSNRILAVLRGNRGIREYYSLTDDYSIADYAYGRLENITSSEKLKTLCAELLRYGAMAQRYKGYCTDTLADGKMTEVHRAFLTDPDAVVPGGINMELPSLKEQPVVWAGKALALDSRITIRYIIDPAAYEGATEDLRLVIRYQDIEGREKTVVLTDPEPYGAAIARLAFDFDGLLAAEIRTVLMATVYDGDVAVSNTLLYSADTYAKGKTGALGDLCNALIAYSDAARAYFQS